MKVAVLGAGKIGDAIARGVMRSSAVTKVYVTRRNLTPSRSSMGKWLGTRDNRAAVTASDVVFIAVKAADARHLLPEIANVTEGKLVISVMAAISLEKIHAVLPGARIVRAMPNVAASVGKAITAYSPGPGVRPQDLRVVRRLFATFGESLEVPEEMMDAVTALSGSGPAYIAILIDAMVSGALKVGLPRDIAFQLVTKTLTGTADLLREKGVHPAELRDLVTTPAGTTIAGIYELEKGAFRTSIMNAIEAATQAAARVSEKL